MSDCVLLIKYTITYLLQNNESGYIKQIKEGKNMKLAMGCDPAAYRFYKKLLERMKEEGYDIEIQVANRKMKQMVESMQRLQK